MSNNKEIDKIFHDLSKNIRREKLILNDLIEKFKEGSLNTECNEIKDFIPTMKEVENNFNKLNEFLKGEQK